MFATRVSSPSRVASPPAAISPLASTGRDGTFLPVDEDREHIVDPEDTELRSFRIVDGVVTEEEVRVSETVGGEA